MYVHCKWEDEALREGCVLCMPGESFVRELLKEGKKVQAPEK